MKPAIIMPQTNLEIDSALNEMNGKRLAVGCDTGFMYNCGLSSGFGSSVCRWRGEAVAFDLPLNEMPFNEVQGRSRIRQNSDASFTGNV